MKRHGEQCKSYGAPALLRVPEHLHITWQDDQTLRMDTDAGKQTRIFHFGNWKAPGEDEPSLQGDSMAEWEMQREGRKVGEWIAEGDDHSFEGRLSAQERRPL